MTSIGDKIGGFLWGIMVKKGAKELMKVILALLASVKISTLLVEYGVTVDKTVLTGSLTVFLAGLLEMLRNFLKNKLGLKFL